ncbi:MAG: translation initiation factor IF-2, partial [Thermoplasmata archaeon]|nr:translation initiation factor IF-2 [Thermoplasmata archaeon]
AHIPIHAADVGPLNRSMSLTMAAVKDPTHRAILAFNVPVLPDAMPEGDSAPVRVFRGDVMYRILEEYQQWATGRRNALSAQRRLDMVHPAKVRVLSGFIFRASKPAIVGVKVLGGRLRPGVRLMQADGSEVGVLRSLQEKGESVQEAPEGAELAASIEGAVVGRNLKEEDIIYVQLPESAARALRKVELTDSERAILEEVVRMRRITEPFWGQ